MATTEELESVRRQSIPILYTRGTHYEVGFDIGRTFASMISNFVKTFRNLQQDFLPLYNTPAGKKVYDDTLKCVKENFPQYVEEIQGTADGAKVPFHELFLLNVDDIMSLASTKKTSKEGAINCSTIIVNEEGQECMGHNEDALDQVTNSFYFVSAHIISNKPQGRWKVTEEKFASLCYAGHLPGYTMSYNKHGLIFCINTLSAKNLQAGKTPRSFLTRALLPAKDFQQLHDILKDSGCGAGNGFSINFGFLPKNNDKKSVNLFYNIEVAPNEKINESFIELDTIKKNQCSAHCNTYLRGPAGKSHNFLDGSSEARMKTFGNLGTPKSKKDVIEMLGDVSNKEYPVFNEGLNHVTTIATGIFDFVARTLSLYSDNAKNNEPLAVLPLDI